MKGGDPEATYVHYVLHKLHWKPHEFFDLSPQEQAVVIASIQVKAEDDKKDAAEARRKATHRQYKRR
ncbi:MAG: hypothetical protein IKR49_07630 [Clostridia bacterium]|nr:hypothetical protein [Clostridia bacterium]